MKNNSSSPNTIEKVQGTIRDQQAMPSIAVKAYNKGARFRQLLSEEVFNETYH